MKEDVLEQIVDDYLQAVGYFTTHNVRFRPAADDLGYVSRLDSVSSDIDVLGFNPKLPRSRRVMVVSCKSYQTGFPADRFLAQLEERAPNPKRPRWMQFRELWDEKWAAAFRRAIEARTGSDRFTYCLAVTRVKGNVAAWETHERIRRNLGGNPLRFLPLSDMWATITSQMTTTPASSEIGRLAQLLRAAGLGASSPVPHT